MLLQKKSQSHFIEINDQEILIARTTSLQAPFVIESIQALPLADNAAWESFLVETLGKKGRKNGFIHAKIGMYAPHRFIRRATIDPRRFKEAGYLNEIVTGQLRIDVDSYSIAILNPMDGELYDPSKGSSKELLFAGLPTQEAHKIQESLIAKSIFPQALELATVAALGGVVDLSTHAQLLNPTLVLDIGADVTHLFIVGLNGVESTRSIQQGLSSMIPVVLKELGLKDEESARRLLSSNTFDFSGMGPTLVKKLITELQSSIGFYEVQTGQSIGQIACLQLPLGLNWLEQTLGSQLGIVPLSLDWPTWLTKHKITLAPSIKTQDLNARWLGVFSLMLPHHAEVAQKKN